MRDERLSFPATVLAATGAVILGWIVFGLVACGVQAAWSCL
jgi:hypothetical protein